MFTSSNAFAPMITGGGLSIHVDAGNVFINGSLASVAASDVTLTANSTNYVYLDLTSGAFAVSTSAFPAYCFPICTVVTDAVGIKNGATVTDNRSDLISFNSVSETVSSSAPASSVRAVIGSITETATSFTVGSNSLVGVRGVNTLNSGSTITGGYLYGAQGKLVVSGTINGSSWTFGLVGQVDISSATLTAGSHVGAIWGDMGSTGPSATVSFADMCVLTNTTATTLNSHVYTYGKAGVVFDLSSNGSACLDASSTAAGSVIGHILCKINGVAGVLRVYSAS